MSCGTCFVAVDALHGVCVFFCIDTVKEMNAEPEVELDEFVPLGLA